MISLVLLASLAQPAATQVAIVPVGGRQLSIDIVPMLEDLDKALRKQAPDGFVYQPADVTRGQVVGARQMGVSCGLEDAACLAKLAALADVDLIVSPIATPVDNNVTLMLFVVNRAGESTSAEALIPSDDTRPATLLALATKALAQVQVVDVTPEPAPEPPAVEPTPAPVPTATPMAEPQPGPSLVFAGAAIAATGGAIALGAGVGALVLDASLAEPEPWAKRQPKMTAGVALVAVCALSSVVAIGGGALLGYALSQE